MDVSVMIDDIKFNYRVATIIRNGDKILLHKSKKDALNAIECHIKEFNKKYIVN